MHVCLHDTGHRCVVTNTQHSWSHWLHCRTKMEARCHARRAAVAALRAGGPAPSICLIAQWSWLQSPMRGWQSIPHHVQQCPGRLVLTAPCTAVSWPACPYRTVYSSVLAGLSLPQRVQQCPGRLVPTAPCTAVSWPACPYRTVYSSVLAGLSLPHCA